MGHVRQARRRITGRIALACLFAWSTGAGAVAVRDNTDQILYGARNRLYVTGNGGIFWRALAVELPEIRDVAWG